MVHIYKVCHNSIHPSQRSTELPLTDSPCPSVISQPAVLDFEDNGESDETDMQLKKLAVDCDARPAQ